jgi:hypothetical protein
MVKGDISWLLLLLAFNKLILLLDIITYLIPITKNAQICNDIRSPFTDFQIIAGQTNLFKKRSEKLFAFSRAFEKIYKLFFQAGILEFRHDIPYQ